MSPTPSRPALTRDRVAAILTANDVDLSGVALLGVRAYFLRSVGDPDDNDIGTYDDAIFVISPTSFVSFNANCDPSIQRYRMANLREGVYAYRVGTHGLSRPQYLQYDALVQAGKVTVDRHDAGPDTGYFGINIHRGGERGTSSLGCQTIPPSQWDSFISLVKSELKRYNQKTISYCLVSNEDGKIV